LGVPDTAITLLPGGCNPETIVPGDPGRARDQLGLRANTFVVGYMGAAALGDLELLFGALRRLLSHVPSAHLLAVGVSVAGSRRAFESTVPSDLRHAVTTIGFTPAEHLGTYFAACDVLALPLKESLANQARWPSRIGDYLAAGRPIVATAVSDARFLFNRQIGLLAAPNPDSFSRAIYDISLQPGQARAFGLNARRLAEGDLSWKTLATGVDQLYRAVISGSRVGTRDRSASLPA
jgi:glycosyltransferase involved in cell wall biosynthesis